MKRELLIISLLAFLSCLLAGWIKGVPYPLVHDEYAYLLMGEMMSHFSVSNPSPAEVEAFETFHVLMEPTVCSKYFPANALPLVLGFWLGLPILGVWFSTTIVAAASVWMLGKYLSRPWPFIGGLVVIASFGFFHYYSQSYYGGNIATLGGILIVGALADTLNHRRSPLSYGLFLLGAMLLLFSRPFEGFFLCLIPGLIQIRSIWHDLCNENLKEGLRALFLTAAAFLFCAVCLTTYNLSTTHQAFQLPYLSYEANYSNGLGEVFSRNPNPQPIASTDTENSAQHPNSFNARRQELHQEYILPRSEWSTPVYLSKVLLEWFVNNGQSLLPLLLFALASRKIKQPTRNTLWLTLAVGISANLWTAPYWYHYLSPILGVALLLSMSGLQHAHQLCVKRNLPFRRYLFQGILLLLIANYLFSGMVRRSREDVDSFLQQQPGSHLVFVSYENGVSANDEWVYNSHRMNQSPIIWARDLGLESNQRLKQIYPERKSWHLNMGLQHATLTSEIDPTHTSIAYPDTKKNYPIQLLRRLLMESP